MSDVRIRVTKDHRTEDGYLFWTGETFYALSGPPFNGGTDVKTAGEYVWIPADIFTVSDCAGDVEQDEDLSDDCNSTDECPSCDSHYKGCPALDDAWT